MVHPSKKHTRWCRCYNTQTQIEIHYDIGSTARRETFQYYLDFWRVSGGMARMILTTILLVAIKKAFYLLTWYTKVDLKSQNEREQKSQLHNSTLKSNVRFRLPLLTSKVMKSPLKRSTYKVMFRKSFWGRVSFFAQVLGSSAFHIVSVATTKRYQNFDSCFVQSFFHALTKYNRVFFQSSKKIRNW